MRNLFIDLNNAVAGAELTPAPRYFIPDLLLDSNIFYDMPNGKYHATPELSSSTLKHATTPKGYKQFLDKGMQIRNNECLIIGTALHSLILEPHKQHQFIIYNEEKLLKEVQAENPDTSPENLKRTKKWRELRAQFLDPATGLFLPGVIEKKRFSSIWELAKELRTHPEIMGLYRHSYPEVSIFAKFRDLNVKIRPDLLKVADAADAMNFGVKTGDIIIMSVKTTIDASPNGFYRECQKLKYDLAEAFYHDIVDCVKSRFGASETAKVHTFYLAVEKDKDGVMNGLYLLRRCTDTHINRGRELYEDALEVYLHCRDTKDYAQGYEFFNNGSIIMDID